MGYYEVKNEGWVVIDRTLLTIFVSESDVEILQQQGWHCNRKSREVGR